MSILLLNFYSCSRPSSPNTEIEAKAQLAQIVSELTEVPEPVQLREITSANPPYHILLQALPEFLSKKELLTATQQKWIDQKINDQVRFLEEKLRRQADPLMHNLLIDFILPPSPCQEVIPFVLQIEDQAMENAARKEEIWYNLNANSGENLGWNDLVAEAGQIWPLAANQTQKSLARAEKSVNGLSETQVQKAIENSRQILLADECWILVRGKDLGNESGENETILISLPYHKLQNALRIPCE
ncbi:MAG: hypothetical protein H6581_13255 [Bacteroidia bacterium]|nr:hypothetical protein [Bacteroidia bacterium]